MRTLTPVALTKTVFAPFGEVVTRDDVRGIEINQGFATRFNGLATIDVAAAGGSVNVCLFVARPRPVPVEVLLMERHPLGSQLFYPLDDRPWLVVTCADPGDAASYRAFTAGGRQGINLKRGVWHSPLLAYGRESRFICLDRVGPGANLDEAALAPAERLFITP
jgi:ureidoglycolate lyase